MMEESSDQTSLTHVSAERPAREAAPGTSPAGDPPCGPEAVLSAAIVALALLANATQFGTRTTTVALVLLPVGLFLGIATHIRLVEIPVPRRAALSRVVAGQNRVAV